jgi:hypothetical protein
MLGHKNIRKGPITNLLLQNIVFLQTTTVPLPDKISEIKVDVLQLAEIRQLNLLRHTITTYPLISRVQLKTVMSFELVLLLLRKSELV